MTGRHSLPCGFSESPAVPIFSSHEDLFPVHFTVLVMVEAPHLQVH